MICLFSELLNRRAEKEKEIERKKELEEKELEEKEREKEREENEAQGVYMRSESCESRDSEYKDCVTGSDNDKVTAGSDDDDEEEYCIIQEIDDEMEVIILQCLFTI